MNDKSETPKGECRECEGSGYELVTENDGDRSYQVPGGPCGRCHGTGVEPPEAPVPMAINILPDKEEEK
jgi:DnaJ-class molecular chaperone